MLIRFTVENFLSFNNQQEFSMIPSKITSKKEHLINNEYTEILKIGTIYGANASGKTSLIKAMNFAKSLIIKDIPLNATSMFCKIDEANESKPSKFEFEFIKDNKCYAYGFTIILKERKFISEWLYELSKTDQIPIFERETEKERLDFYIEPSNDDDRNILGYYKLEFTDDIKKLVLNRTNQTKKISPSSNLVVLKSVYEWFLKDLRIIYPNQPVMRFENLYTSSNVDKISEILNSFDTGISKVKIEEISRHKLLDELSTEAAETFLDSFKEAFDNVETLINSIKSKKNATTDNDKYKKIKNIGKVGATLRTEDSFYNISGRIGEEPVISTIKTEHPKSFWDYNFREESDGTRRLFDLIEILLSGELDDNVNKVYVVDELERSLHPKLTYNFIKLFIKILEKKNVQLIFTTHESTIMDQNLLRRDEIWFVERNKENSSRLYSLDRFKERYDKKINKSYLDGRYGAIPIFKDFSFEEDL